MTQKVQIVLDSVTAEIAAGRLRPGDAVPTVRELAYRTGSSPGTAARAHARLRDTGVIAGPERSHATVTPDGPERARTLLHGTREIRVSGSDDPALDLLYAHAGSGLIREGDPAGSLSGLEKLARGTVDASAVHLHSSAPRGGNATFTGGVLGGGPATLVHLWRREQGIVVPRGNPQAINGIAELHGRELAWRGVSSGTRLLLQRLLREHAVAPRPAAQVYQSHLGVAVAVAAGAADAGIAVRAAAVAVEADFIPLEWEDFDLAVSPTATGGLPPVLATLTSQPFRRQLARMPGYDTRASAELRRTA